MAVELIRSGAVLLTITDLTDITIVQVGRDAELLAKRVRRLSAVLNTPNGRKRFKGVIINLPVVSHMPCGEEGALFSTTGGSVIRVAIEETDALLGRSRELGLFDWSLSEYPEPLVEAEVPQVDWNLSAFLAKKFGCYVEVVFYADGHYGVTTEYPDLKLIDEHILQYVNRYWRTL